MKRKDSFLSDLAENEDAVLLKIVGALGEQRLRAQVLNIYATRHGVNTGQLGKQIEFTYAPTTYGNTALKVGETAIVFMSDESGELHEAPWRGHMVIEDIDGEPHAIFPHLVVAPDATDPSAHARPDPTRPHASAISFALIEDYLSKLFQ
jgi:hypothetical protein